MEFVLFLMGFVIVSAFLIFAVKERVGIATWLRSCKGAESTTQIVGNPTLLIVGVGGVLLLAIALAFSELAEEPDTWPVRTTAELIEAGM